MLGSWLNCFSYLFQLDHVHQVRHHSSKTGDKNDRFERRQEQHACGILRVDPGLRVDDGDASVRIGSGLVLDPHQGLRRIGPGVDCHLLGLGTIGCFRNGVHAQVDHLARLEQGKPEPWPASRRRLARPVVRWWLR